MPVSGAIREVAGRRPVPPVVPRQACRASSLDRDRGAGAMNALTTAPLLAVNGLVKRYEADRTPLAGVDLHAHGGEVLGLLGRNGAGKTTLVGACTTRVRPTAGTIRLGGLDVSRHPSE